MKTVIEQDNGKLTIITNGHARELVSFWDIPEKERHWFDYVNNYEERYSPRFFQYRGEWYDSSEFTYVPAVINNASDLGLENFRAQKWDGIQTESYFSGVLIRYANDYDNVIVGRYYV